MAAGSWEVLGELTPFLIGTTLLAWGFATWWIPLLLAIGIWRHGMQHVPLRCDPPVLVPGLPVGHVRGVDVPHGAVIEVGLPAAVVAVAFWIAFSAWLVTAIGMTSAFVGRRGRAR